MVFQWYFSGISVGFHGFLVVLTVDFSGFFIKQIVFWGGWQLTLLFEQVNQGLDPPQRRVGNELFKTSSWGLRLMLASLPKEDFLGGVPRGST